MAQSVSQTIVLIDNYDSFTYNLYQMISTLAHKVEIFRNDQITIDEIQKLNPLAIVISPGPGTPSEAGICNQLIQKMACDVPILGVCLGMQAIAESFGAKIIRAEKCVHGKASSIIHRNRGVFKGISSPFKAARYHSLQVDPETLPGELQIEAESTDGVIMALSHVEFPLWGVQFHPESILTQEGEPLLKNFLKISHSFNVVRC